MIDRLKSAGLLLKDAALDWIDDQAPRLSAALAYYTIFSLAPLLIVVLAIVSAVWGDQSGTVQQQFMGEVAGLVGRDGADMIETMLDNASRPGGGSTLAAILGVAALLFGATGVFGQLQSALNQIWEVEPAPGRGLAGFVRTRLLSFGMILGVGFLLLVSLVVSALLSALDTFLTDLAPATHTLVYVLNLVVSLAIITGLFALIYRVLPDVKIAWRDVFVGAFVTALLFVLGKFAIGLYLGNSAAASTYGAAGSLVILLLWIYYSSMILFFGAEVTQIWARRYGTRIEPDEGAILREDARKAPAEPKTPSQPTPPPRPLPTVRKAQPSALKRFGVLLLVYWVGRFLGKRSA